MSKKGKSPRRKDLKNILISLFSNHPQKTFNYKQVAKQLDFNDSNAKKNIIHLLEVLHHENFLIEIARGKYKLKSKGGHITGIVDLIRSGAAYIISPELEEDVFVAQSNLKHALNGDKVSVYLYARRKGSQLQGEVTEIIERQERNFVGIIEMLNNFAFLIPDNKDMPYDIFIPEEKLFGVKNNQKAIVKIIDWPKTAKNPFGQVVEILGNPGENNTEMHAILAEFGLPNKFPPEIEKQAKEISQKIPKEEIKARRDFRDTLCFTIDPHDAKDFDDALSFKKLNNGHFEIGIHIADVTHYVKTETPLDKEAFHRGTSVYLVDRVVPMLPEKLSNMLCSLRPNEDKLCFSVVVEIDETASIHNKWIGKTIINSKRRYSYQEAQEVIDQESGDYSEEIGIMNQIASRLRSDRFKKGALGFDRVEVKFKLDDTGKPLGIYYKESAEANWLIEEFMLLANKIVAEIIGRVPKNNKAKTFVYRVHDRPDPEKIENFSNFINKMGYSIKTGSERAIADSMNKLLHQVKGKNVQDVVETLAIRTMAKAKYSVKNIGHYGLGFPFYTHFTSPIRRYPDMMVHRMLEVYLNDGKSFNENLYEEKCKHASLREEKASDAERASIKYKQVEFMSDKIGQVFDGVISGLSEWGIFVEIVENKCEGLIPIRELDDDFYEYNDKEHYLIGQRRRKAYHLGDKLKIRIAKANILKRQLDFELVE